MTSGRCCRMARTMSRRSASPYSTTPSRWSRNSTMSTPTSRAPGALLRLAQRRGLIGVHAVDAGLAPGGQQVGDPLALCGPARDGRRGAVLDVVGMRDHGQAALPVLRQHGQQISHESVQSRHRPMDSGRCIRRPAPRSGVQQRVPLTRDNLADVRQQHGRRGAGRGRPRPSVRTVVDVDAGGVPARLYRAVAVLQLSCTRTAAAG